MSTLPITDVEFRHQFRISKETRDAPEGWHSFQINDWKIRYCPTLQLTKLSDKQGSLIGCILGWAIDSNGSMLAESLKLDLSIKDDDCIQKIERLVSYLSGRFIALSSPSKNSTRLYLDPAGQLSTVYNASSGEIASSLFLISTYQEPADDLSELLDFPNLDRFFPFGLTINENVFRVLPNHYLNLQSFAQIRHWPKKSEIERFQNSAVNEIPRTIGKKIKNNINSIAKRYPLSIYLTAGKDSRMLLAATKELTTTLSAYTFQIPDIHANLDCKVAKILSKRHQLNHKALAWKTPTEKDLVSWQIRGGYSGSGRTWQSVTTVKELDSSKVFLTGVCGEVGRAFYWDKTDLSGGSLSPSLILKRLGFPEHPTLLSKATDWLIGLPKMDYCDALDILYIEQRLGCWAGPNYYGHINGIRFPPLSDRKIFELMLALPKDYRYEGTLPEDIIVSLWPELLDLPFNQPFGLTSLSWKARSALQEFFTLYPSAKKFIPWLKK